jgi:uncharacterized membrane protein
MCAPIFPLFLLIIGLVVILPIVLICVLLGSRRSQPATQPSQPPEAIDPAERNRKREAILNQLAAKEITKEDAEQQLLELDNPVPEQLPIAPPPPRRGCGAGCLVAVICAIVAVILLLLFLFGLNIFHVTMRPQHITYQHEVR